MSVAVVGLGEAGNAIAADVARLGVVVTGYDPASSASAPPGAARAGTLGEAVAGADVVLSLVPATAAVEVARSASSALAPGTLYGDCAAGSPNDKRAAARTVEAAGAYFADVALMAPVPGKGIATPALLAGSGAKALAERLTGWGMPAAVVSETAGDAAARKLLRSVFMKGMAAVLGEALDAAQQFGCYDWLRAEITDELSRADGVLVDRLEHGSVQHAGRRVYEMEAALQVLHDKGASTRLSEATLARLRAIAGRQSTGGVP